MPKNRTPKQQESRDKRAVKRTGAGHRLVVDAAMDAIVDVFSDTRVGPLTTIESLEELRDEIEMKIGALREDVRRKEREDLGK